MGLKAESETKTYSIGPFRLDVASRTLTRLGVPEPLGPRAVAVLAAIVARAPEPVPKATIISEAWPGLVVEDNNLTVQIAALRRTLGQVAGGDRWVETIARRGYRFVGPVIAVAEGGGPTERALGKVPLALTSFVGRERELVELKVLLAKNRLLTIVGPGGIGKTRLAMQALSEVVDAYRDGIRFVDLAALRDGALVATTVAHALGVPEKAGGVVASLGAHLRRRQMLLVLDNCEYVRSECADLSAALLQAASAVTIVATSREPLQIEGERIYALSALSLPEAEADPAAIERSEAVQLFVERAERQQRGFAVTRARAFTIAEICRHLDGIPLAIELAAARVRSLSVEQILDRIDDRFRLLASIATADPRHQTLRATLDWSFDLLAEDERIVLRRIAMFAGGFTLHAAAAVAADDALDEYAIVDVLARLVARSLVTADTSESGARYRLLETTRAYALERLADAGEVDDLARTHARYMCDLFERAAADWWHRADAEWQHDYRPELDNVRAALSWALGRDGDPRIGVALAASAGPLWMELALVREGRRWIDAAARQIGADTPETQLAKLWRAQGALLEAAPPQALPVCERAVAMYRRLATPLELGLALVQLAATLTYVGEFASAAAHFAEALPLIEFDAPPKAVGSLYLHYGAMQTLRGEPAAGRANYERALSLFRRVGADRLSLLTLMYLADLTWTTGDLTAALSTFRETIALARRSPLRRLHLGYCLVNLTGVHLERGEQEDALFTAREGVPLLCEGGQLWLLADHVALLAALAGHTVTAAQLAGYADATREAMAASRQANEARSRQRLQEILATCFYADDLARYFIEGARLDEEHAAALALTL